MKGLRVWIRLLTMMLTFAFVQRVQAQPVYINDYLLQGEAIGTVIDIDPTVRIRSEKTIVDVRGWVPSLTAPVLRATTTYELDAEEDQRFSLFSISASKEPKIVFNGDRVLPSVAQYPLSQIFYDSSFTSTNTIDNPLSVLLSKDQLMGYTLSNKLLPGGLNTLEFEQGFDVRVDSQYFVRHYSLFLLNPQWQGQHTGLMRAWEVTAEILIPPSWTVRSNVLFERNKDVVSFQLDPSQAVLQAELIPPHNQRLYKLVKSSLWLLLMVMGVVTAFLSYAAGIFVERTRIPPRVMMLSVVVVCMAMDWVLSKQLTNYLETEALLHHLSLRTVHQIQYNHWVHQFYGAILTALIACLVFLRSLGIDFFHEYEVVVDVQSMEEQPEPNTPEASLEEEIAPPQFTLLSSDTPNENHNADSEAIAQQESAEYNPSQDANS